MTKILRRFGRAHQNALLERAFGKEEALYISREHLTIVGPPSAHTAQLAPWHGEKPPWGSYNLCAMLRKESEEKFFTSGSKIFSATLQRTG